ncbi:MAG: class I SAM-dependent DNA methyltransferase [Polyangia bacterium]
MAQNLDAFISKWAAAGAAERANKDMFLAELCGVLGVETPNPAMGDPERDTYVFEREARLAHEGGETTIGRIDLYKQGCFILEAKQASGEGSSKLGKAKRGTPAWNILMKEAYGQALGYARSFDRPEPFIIVCDIGHCFDLYATFDGTSNYRPFPNAQASRIFLRDLTEHAGTLRRVFEEPLALDPSKHSMKVTREVAAHLAALAKKLEDDGNNQELVAQFLMRCLFTMFAEDVGLLPEGIFTKALKEQWLPHPTAFPGGVASLWRTMNEGGEVFGVVGKILRFNGGLFASPKALALDKKALALLLQAAECNWADVEPAIFGTLLERALDPKERHAFGAHFTPRAYVERLVRPTIEEPLRADWEVVQAHVRQIVVTAEHAKTAKASKDKLKEAVAVVREFHQKLCHTRVLDPACGSGNFLYVTLDLFERLEGEVLVLLESLGETQTMLHMESVRVTPAQFHGIEIKRWGKEIAELVLWIGYLQWHFRTYGKTIRPEEPILRDYKNIECRDAVLAYDGEPEPVLDEKGRAVTRWDGESMKTNPVTDEQVPDESKRVPVYKYKNPRKAEWPEADFIVGNPPFVGNSRMRSALGEGYAETLRATYPEVPESVDYVMYWWDKAAELARQGAVKRFGFITTNSLTQAFARRVLQRHMDATPPLSLVFAVPDHPWVDSENGAAVRIAMTVAMKGEHEGRLCTVIKETETGEGSVEVLLQTETGRIHADLTTGANVASAQALLSNQGISCPGVKLHGAGFIVTPEEADKLGLGHTRGIGRHIRDYRNGKDITQQPRGVKVIDLFGLSEEELRKQWPSLYQWVFERVKPERDAKGYSKDGAAYARLWWLHGKPRQELRASLHHLGRFISTVETSKHRFFVFLDKSILPDNMLVNIAIDDAFALGVLSSRIHVCWALAAGGTLEDRPRYNKTVCFEPFPFPVVTKPQTERIRDLAEELDSHRKRQQAAHSDLTITSMYNVLEKLRSGEALTAKDKVIHEQGLVSVLKKLHDDLDAAVFDAYGWPRDLTDEQILERLVALNAERAAEEKRGLVRWLRPEFQNPGGAKTATQERLAATDEPEQAVAQPAAAAPWPKKLADRIGAIRDLVTKAPAAWSVEMVASAFKGANKGDVEEVLDSLAALGILAGYKAGGGRRWKLTRATA